MVLEHWSAAVAGHQPGQMDAATLVAAGLSEQDRADLEPGLNLFFLTLAGTRGVPVRRAEEKAVADLGAKYYNTLGATAFLERAAMLHADVVALGARPAHAPSPSPRPANVDPLSPLFASSSLYLATDGEHVGGATTNWNWTFARSLLDLIKSTPAPAPFVGQWYHATIAYLLATGQYGEAAGQLKRATALLPNDARILFDQACLSEIYELPSSQQILTDQDRLEMRRKPPSPIGMGFSRAGDARPAAIPLPEVAHADALSGFRRTLEIDPHFVEAAVRLARLLEADGHPADAMVVLKTALETPVNPGDPAVLFYAHLFATRAEDMQGRVSNAADENRAALSMYPDAQSALLMQSHIALRQGDQTAVQTALDHLAELRGAADVRADPWWLYGLGPGRNARALLTDLWSAAEKTPSGPQ